ncbi:MAG: hypothetical protein K9N07_00740 [Candidatus Cloacimonetes bacterium]|nr:hypothetical protein [Candidatus Cloacimonadota bacterium]
MKIMLYLSLLLMVIAGCSTEGDIRFINRTNHDLFFNIKGNDYVLAGSETEDTEMTISVYTGKEVLFIDEGPREVDLHLEGETFMMQYAINGTPIGEYYTDTTLNVQPGKTMKIYCDPTHAGVKLINNSIESVVGFSYYTDDLDSLITMIDTPLQLGDSTWSRLKASSEIDSISYSFLIEFENGFIDSSYINIHDLTLDEQFRIVAE